MIWSAQAPANLALIKYMGKISAHDNRATNPSLSYTLNHLQSFVELETSHEAYDRWAPLNRAHCPIPSFNPAQQKKYLTHLQRLKDRYQYQDTFIVRSCNNFPANAGLASSASSFAALSLCAMQALAELTQKPTLSPLELAHISRLGSGSSCRSFFSPWTLWDDNNIQAIALPYPNLVHKSILISQAPKPISSSEAHIRITSSPYYAERATRARQRLTDLLAAFKDHNWSQAFNIVWDEFRDMHQLFSTCQQPFAYLDQSAEEVLTYLQHYWQTHQDGPLVTVDAGPNIHLLFRSQACAAEIQQALKHYVII